MILDLTHANFKRPISVNSELLFSWYFSESHLATHLISTNGGIIPVIESKETIDTLMRGKHDTRDQGHTSSSG